MAAPASDPGKGNDEVRKRQRVDPFFGVLIALIVMAGLVGILLAPASVPIIEPEEASLVPRDQPTIRAADSILVDVRSRRELARRDAELMSERARRIAGLAPAEVLGGMQQRGFRIDTLLVENGTPRWECTREDLGAVYTVNVTGDGPDHVKDISARVKADRAFKSVQATQDFFGFFAHLRYDSANPRQADEWMNAYSGKGVSVRDIAYTRFELSAPDRKTRHLKMSPVPPEEQARAGP